MALTRMLERIVRHCIYGSNRIYQHHDQQSESTSMWIARVWSQRQRLLMQGPQAVVINKINPLNTRRVPDHWEYKTEDRLSTHPSTERRTYCRCTHHQNLFGETVTHNTILGNFAVLCPHFVIFMFPVSSLNFDFKGVQNHNITLLYTLLN